MPQPLTADSFPVGLRIASGRSATLRRLLASGPMVAAPGCYDCITARLVEVSGFSALYVTGSGVSMSAMGAPDVGALSFAEILDRVRRICDTVSIPVIADADTGYGGPLNVIRTVREFERAGVSGIQIEDQEWPKKCGHEPGRRLVSIREMQARIRAATDARLDADTVIIARTDARTDHGLEAALERAAAYREAGADVLFVESPQTAAELSAIPTRLAAPCLANMVEGGRTPILPGAELDRHGFRLAIYPNSLTRLIGRVGQDLLAALRTHGTTASMANQMLDHGQLWQLFDNKRWTELERRYQVE